MRIYHTRHPIGAERADTEYITIEPLEGYRLGPVVWEDHVAWVTWYPEDVEPIDREVGGP